MADTPTAAYSIRIRARLSNVPGTLGRLAIAIGEVGGNIAALEGFEAKQRYLDEDVVVNCRSVEHQQEVKDHLDGIEGVESLRGAAMEWPDVVAAAGTFATALGIGILDAD